MPLKFHVTSRSPITDRDVLATGADYFSMSRQDEIKQHKNLLQQALNQLHDRSGTINGIFDEIQGHLNFFEECLVALSKGYNLTKEANNLFKFKAFLAGFSKIKKLQASAPKTHDYFQLIESKYLYFLRRLNETLTHSDPNTFYAPNPIPLGFKLDDFCAQSLNKYDPSPLMQAIIQTSLLLAIYCDIYRQLYEDHLLRHHPEYWQTESTNISASGMALMIKKAFKLHEKLDVLIYFEDNNKVLTFEGIVVNIQKQPDQSFERVAINFEHAHGTDQTYLLAQIQKYELQQCF
ncbi:hypothetical protein THIAE_01840 [Thiomicrospira aerophila AL3]|uniref:PilZ domain-containing protein n=2 Tax=Thiomicrospira aerophila TaxID=92245 RepID=W0DY59_9GAMM|nr:hypothetical protein THIAE_01840 [Thiomicrospira aerophila AL3]